MTTATETLLSSLAKSPTKSNEWEKIWYECWPFLEEIKQKKVTSDNFKKVVLSLCQYSSPPNVRHVLSLLIMAWHSDPTRANPHQLYSPLEKILLLRPSNNSRIACIESIASIFEVNGWQLGSLLADTVSLISKQSKSSETHVRHAAFAALVKITAGSQRSGQFVHSEILKIIKTGISENDKSVRRLCGLALRTVADHAVSEWTQMLDIATKERPARRGAETYGYILSRAHLFSSSQKSKQHHHQQQQQQQQQQQLQQSSQTALQRSLDFQFATVSGVLSYLTKLWLSKLSRPEGRTWMKYLYLGYFSGNSEVALKKSLGSYIENVLSLAGDIMKSLDSVEDYLHASDCAFSILTEGLGSRITGKGRQLITSILLQKMTENLQQDYKLLVTFRSFTWFLLKGAQGPDNWDTFTKVVTPCLDLQNPHVNLWCSLSLKALAEVQPHWTVPMLSYFAKELSRRLEQDSNLAGVGYALVALVGSKPENNNNETLTLPVPLRDLLFELGTKLICIPTPAICHVGWTLLAAFCTRGPVVVLPYLNKLIDYWRQHLAIQAEPSTDMEVNRLLLVKSSALSSFQSFIVYCPVLLTQEILDLFKSPYHHLLKLAVNLSKKETDSSATMLSANVNLLHHLVARAMAVADALPSIDHVPGRKELSLLMSHAIANPPKTRQLSPSLNASDSCLSAAAAESEGSNPKDSDHPIEVGNVHADRLWNGQTESTLLDASTWSPSPRRIMVEQSIKISPKILLPLRPEKVGDIFKFIFRCYDSARGEDKAQVETNVLAVTMALLRYMLEVKKLRDKPTVEEGTGLAVVFASILGFVEPLMGTKDLLKRRAVAEIIGTLAALQNDSVVRNIIKRVSVPLTTTTDEKTAAGCALALACIHRYIGGVRSRAYHKDSLKTLSSLFRFESISAVHLWGLHSIWVTFKEAAGLTLTSTPEAEAMLTTICTLLQHEAAEFDTHMAVLSTVGALANAYVGALGPEILLNPVLWNKCLVIRNYLETAPSWSPQIEAIRMRQTQFLLFPNAEGRSEFTTLIETGFCNPHYRPLRKAAVTAMHVLLQYKSDQFPKIELKLFQVLDKETDASLIVDIKSLVQSIIRLTAPHQPSVWIAAFRDIILGPKKVEAQAAAAAAAAAAAKASMNTTAVADLVADAQQDEFGSVMIRTEDSASTAEVWTPSVNTQVFVLECLRQLLQSVGPDSRHRDLVKAQEDIEESEKREKEQKEKERKKKGGKAINSSTGGSIRDSSGGGDTEKGKNSRDWLVLSHQVISDMTFRAVSSAHTELRRVGLELLGDFQKVFGDSMDPDYEGHFLLEMYEGQMGLAYRGTIKQTSNPNLQLLATSLTGKIVQWILTHFDKTKAGRNVQKYIAVMSQTLNLVTSARLNPPNPFKNPPPSESSSTSTSISTSSSSTATTTSANDSSGSDPSQKSYSLSSSSTILSSSSSESGEFDYYSDHELLSLQLVLVQTFAEIYISVPSDMMAILSAVLPKLKTMWTTFLRDSAILFTQENNLRYAHKATFYDVPIIRDVGLRERLFVKWQAVLEASAKSSEYDSAEWHIMLGLSIYGLCSSNNMINKRHCLNSIGWLFSQEESIKANPPSPDVVKEILLFLQNHKNDDEKSFRPFVLSLLLKLVPTIGKEYLQKSNQLNEQIGMILESETRSNDHSLEESNVVVQLASSLMPIIKSSPQQISWALQWILKDLERQNLGAVQIQLRVNTIINILQTREDEVFKHATLRSIMSRLDEIDASQEISQHHPKEYLQQNLMLTLMRILPLLSGGDDGGTNNDGIIALHQSVLIRIHRSLAEGSPNLRILVLTLFLTFVEAAFANTADSNNNSQSTVHNNQRMIASAYVYQLLPSLLLILQTTSHHNNPQDQPFLMEIIKFLVILNNICLSTPSSPTPTTTTTTQRGILSILLPTFLGLLNVTTPVPSMLHQTALQLILGFAQTHKEECAAVLEGLPDQQKQVLQLAVHANILREQERERKEKERLGGAGAGQQLTLDVTKF